MKLIRGKQYIQKRLCACARPVSPEALSIGLEHEFFLLNSKGDPVTHDEGQVFLRRLSQEKGWHIQETDVYIDGTSMLARVSFDDPRGRYTAVKYDHHPHLFEIAFAYEDSLSELYDSIRAHFETLESCADQSGLKLSHRCLLNTKGHDPRVVSPHKDFVALRHYRKKLYELRGETPDLDAINYASLITATQIHIGGTFWWERPNYVSRLYSYEPDLLYYSTLNVRSHLNSPAEILKARWQGYESVFKEYPLIGYPHMKNWSIEDWVCALEESPLAGGADSSWAARRLCDLDENPFVKRGDFFAAVRDLQIIRPKLYGTLEFRADPAQTSPEAVLFIAALRLGLCIHAMDSNGSKNDFTEARDRWWATVHGKLPLQSNHLLSFAEEGLRRHSIADLKWLNIVPFSKKEAS